MREKRFLPIFLLILAAVGFGQQPASVPSATPAATDLNSVLAQMDEAGKRFKSAEADVKWETYTAVVKDTDVQTGRIYSRRRDGGQEVAIHLLKPHPKLVLIQHDKAIIYDPKINQRTERSIGDKADAEPVMNVASAFGIKGQDLLRDYEVKLIGWDIIDTVNAAKLELVPRKDNVRKLFSKVLLWIDPRRDVALQQQRFTPDSGDYQLAHYTNIKLNDKISDDVFSIKKGGNGD